MMPVRKTSAILRQRAAVRRFRARNVEYVRQDGRVRDRARYASRRSDPQKSFFPVGIAGVELTGRGRANAAIRKARMLSSAGAYNYRDVVTLYAMQQGRCAAFWCRTDLTGGYHVDHVTALAKGGTNGPENLQLLCAPCNTSKADDCMFDFYLRKMGGKN